MKIVSPFLKKVLYPSLSAAGVFRRSCPPGLAVVTYHGVLPSGYEPVDAAFDGNLISAETLRSQLCLLKKSFHLISPDQALAWRKGDFELPPRALLFTCDDGLLNTLTEMLPVLLQEEVQCLFFVTGASAGETRCTLWYEDLFLLLLEAPAGRFEFSSHGVTIGGGLTSREARRAVCWEAVKRLSQLDAETRRAFVCAAAGQIGTDPSTDRTRNLADKDSPFCRRFGLLTLPEL